MRPTNRLVRRLSALAAVGAIASATLAATGSPASAQTAPTAVTTSATSVTATSAVLNGSVNPNLSTTTYYFEYGTTAGYGQVTPSSGAGAGSVAIAVSATVTGLVPNTTYYFQLVATNVDGSSVGGQTTVITSGTVLATSSRIAGNDRYQTAAQIAETKYPGGVPSGNVVIATGLDFPDALAGNYLAGQLSAPILLSPTTTGDPAWPTVVAALTALNPSHVYIVGGTDAIGADVASALAQSYTVVRIAGATRYDTMQAIDTYAGLVPGLGSTGLRTAIVATGENFPDALAAGPLVWADKLPLILTDGSQPTLSPQAAAVISALGTTHFIVLGGAASINAGIVTQLEGLGTVDAQFAGQDRTDTAAQLAGYEQSTYAFPKTSVVLATGLDYPDALAGGPFGGDPKSMYFTLTNDTLGSFTTSALESLNGLATVVYVLGGDSAVDDTAAAAAVTAVQGGGSGTLAPTVITGAASSVTATTATLNASVDPQSSATTVSFQYGTSAASLTFTSSAQVLAASTGLQNVAVTVSGLAPDQTYYFRAVATNSYGTNYGLVQGFTTGSGQLTPQATTLPPTTVSGTGATFNGTVDPNGTDTSYYYAYGTSQGSLTSSVPAPPGNDAGAGNVALQEPVAVNGLTPSTIYYVQLVASNAYGPAPASQIVAFTTAAPVVTSLGTVSGTTAGGTAVLINGTGFAGASAVAFGANPASNVVVNASGTQISVQAPAGAAGTVEVRVTTPFGTSALNPPNDQYTYEPTMTSAVATAGTYAGGTAEGTAGTVDVTFSTAVTCPRGADYDYTGGVVFATCTAVGGSPSTQFVLAPANATMVAAGGTVTYTQGAAPPTTADSTYASTGGGPVFEPTGDAVA
jgi:putative cell wall-binding protein